MGVPVYTLSRCSFVDDRFMRKKGENKGRGAKYERDKEMLIDHIITCRGTRSIIKADLLYTKCHAAIGMTPLCTEI